MKNLIIIVASTIGAMAFCQYKTMPNDMAANPGSELKPSVELTLAENSKNISWGSQVRYAIHVSDQVDGNSKYAEIDANKVFLSVSFFPNITDSSDLVFQEKKSKLANLEGLTLMGQGSCFSCHADENSITGPSFSEIATNSEKNNRQTLIHSIRKGSKGQWDNMTMPANPEYSEEDAARMVEYIIRQGTCKHCWVYPGLEGVLKIITAPEDVDTGMYLLTASYTSSSGMRGKDSVVLNIK